MKEAWTGAETMNVPDPVELDDPRRYSLQRNLKDDVPTEICARRRVERAVERGVP